MAERRLKASATLRKAKVEARCGFSSCGCHGPNRDRVGRLGTVRSVRGPVHTGWPGLTTVRSSKAEHFSSATFPFSPLLDIGPILANRYRTSCQISDRNAPIYSSPFCPVGVGDCGSHFDTAGGDTTTADDHSGSNIT